MKKPIQITIPTPCHENWQQMTPVVKGRFCASCDKKVFDFTVLSDREIASTLKQNEYTCARLKVNQMNRNLVIPKEKKSIWMAASAAVVSFLTFGSHTISAQTPINTEQHATKNDDIKKETVQAPFFLVTGKVLDENGMPMLRVEIINQNSGKITTTDFDGSFSIRALKNNNLIIRDLLCFSQKIEIVNTNPLLIVLKYNPDADDDFMVVGYVETAKNGLKHNKPAKQNRHRELFNRIFSSKGYKL